jgi:membrane-bound metal-dependent hydrolase YbcI (DUF457 family)
MLEKIIARLKILDWGKIVSLLALAFFIFCAIFAYTRFGWRGFLASIYIVALAFFICALVFWRIKIPEISPEDYESKDL